MANIIDVNLLKKIKLYLASIYFLHTMYLSRSFVPNNISVDGLIIRCGQLHCLKIFSFICSQILVVASLSGIFARTFWLFYYIRTCREWQLSVIASCNNILQNFNWVWCKKRRSRRLTWQLMYLYIFLIACTLLCLMRARSVIPRTCSNSRMFNFTQRERERMQCARCMQNYPSASSAVIKLFYRCTPL